MFVLAGVEVARLAYDGVDDRLAEVLISVEGLGPWLLQNQSLRVRDK